MIYFLENHGPIKFSEIFLGEFDTPEAIWMTEMRRTLIQKIALHLGDFIPRLLCNTRALYQVSKMYNNYLALKAGILQESLFCSLVFNSS